MGTEASKPIGPPDEWEGRGNEFQIISPVSDLSNPSDIHKFRRTYDENHPANTHRRATNTLAKSHSNHIPLDRGVPPPSAFYFPTKDTERMNDRALARPDAIVESKGDDKNGGLKKMIKKTQQAMSGCFAEPAHEVELDEINAVHQERMARTSQTKQAARREAAQRNSRSHHVSKFDTTNDIPHHMPYTPAEAQLIKVKGRARKSRQDTAKGRNDVHVVSAAMTGASDVVKVDGAAIHQEDAYFKRLTAEPSRYSQVQESPYVESSKILEQVASALDDCGKMSGSEQGSPVSNLFDDREEEKEKNKKSTVNTLLRMQGKGDLEVYSDEDSKSIQVFLDETQDSTQEQSFKQAARGTKKSTEVSKSSMGSLVSNHMGLIALDQKTRVISRESSGGDGSISPSSSAMSYFRPGEREAKSVFQRKAIIPTKPFNQVAALGPAGTYEDSTAKVSKLEALFRPILPSLSADDAQTISSFDPYQIKVTESAPGVIESTDYRALALRRISESPARGKIVHGASPSIMSIDSQNGLSPYVSKDLVSSQAKTNSEFLFASQYNNKTRSQKQATGSRDSSMFSISTLGARSRLSQRSLRSQAVVINARSAPIDNPSSRRVRFSSDTYASTDSGRSFMNKPTEVNAPQIENKMSDLSESVSDNASLISKKSESATTVSQASKTDTHLFSSWGRSCDAVLEGLIA